VSRPARWPFALVAAAAILTYANALGHPLLFDDAGSIIDNPTIRSVASSIRGGPVQGALAGRPIVNISLALNYAAHGVAPWGYHAVNLAVHALCAMLVFALLRRLLRLPLTSGWADGRQTGIAATIAVLWTVHPLNSEVINYATQRTEQLMALAFLSTLYCGVRAIDSPRPLRWQAASVAACAVGMSCKESMVTAPVVMLLIETAFTRRGLPAVARQRAGYYGALFGTWIVLAALIIEGPRWRSAGFSSGVSPWTYLLNQPRMIVRYLRLVFVPTGLVLDYGTPAARTPGEVLPAGLAVVMLLAATVAAWRYAPLLGFFATWFFITLAPTTSILPIATEVGAERRMYLPLIGALAMVVLVGSRVMNRLDAPRRTALARTVVGALCIGLAALTVLRNREYAQPLRIWETSVERWPTPRSHYNYGLDLMAAGRRAEALEEYRRALPGAADAHYALGFDSQAQGRYDEAIEQYRAFIAQKPDDINVPKAYHQIARCLLAQQKPEEALVAFREALARNRHDQGSLVGVADTLQTLNRLPDAVAAYQRYLREFPNQTAAMMNLGVALVKLDRDAEARDLFAAVVQLEPDNVAAHVNLAYAMANTGRYGDSLEEFRRASRLEKDPAGRAEIDAAIAQLLGSH
jgi:protein O-mannosyl-transferase